MIRQLFRIAAAALLFVLTQQGTGRAASQTQVDHVRLVMFLETPARPNKTIWVAIRQTIEPGWHTYWRNPGDAGLATAISWHLPRGVSVGELHWPAPESFSSGPVVSYGYQREATLLVPLTIGRAGFAGSSEVRADISLLECAQMCIPEHASLDIDLTRATGSPTSFAAARAALPRRFSGSVQLASDADTVTLAISGELLQHVGASAIHFYPETKNAVSYDMPPMVHVDGSTLIWRTKRPSRAKPLGTFSGVLDIRGIGAFEVSATRASASAIPSHGTENIGLLGAVLFAFLGGLVLNLMPCVLPILSMKALALARSEENARDLRRDGVFYFAGVQVTFAVVAGVLVILRAGGEAVGWGYQLQSPLIVFGLALLTAAIGLNLLGVFEIPLRFAGVGDGLTRAEGGRGAFFTGALAVLVASPCTAPFMGTALGYTLTQSSAVSAAIFLALGSGFALPFSALAFTPILYRLVPRPGPWMVRFKEFLAFPMFATAIWLVYVLDRQVGAFGFTIALCIGLGFVFLTWLMALLGPRLRWIVGVPGLALLAASCLQIRAATPSVDSDWAPWSGGAVSAAREAHRPVLVDFSAAWCVTCIVNERLALQNSAVVARLQKYNVVTLKGDWTDRSAAIAAELGRYGRAGVPLYLLYPPDAHEGAIVLPQILTPAAVLSALDRMENVRPDR